MAIARPIPSSRSGVLLSTARAQSLMAMEIMCISVRVRAIRVLVCGWAVVVVLSAGRYGTLLHAVLPLPCPRNQLCTFAPSHGGAHTHRGKATRVLLTHTFTTIRPLIIAVFGRDAESRLGHDG